MTLTEDDLDVRLHSADHASEFQLPEATGARLLAATRQQALRRRRIRIGAIIGVLGLTVVGGLAAAPATADAVRHFLAQSSWHPKAGGEVLPDSEWVNVDAPDLSAYVATRWEDFLPLAPGQTRQSVIDAVVKAWVGETGVTQEVGFRDEMEQIVYRAWICEWISADDAHDAARMSTAASVIAQVPTWPAYVATDGGGITDAVRLFSNGISAGDRNQAEAAAQQEGLACWDGTSRRDLIDAVWDQAHAIWDAKTGTNE